MDRNIRAEQWLRSAHSDLKNIEHIIKDDYLTHIVAFHSQQTIEKVLKAILVVENKPIQKIHKLQNLVSKIDISIDYDNKIIQILDELYIDSRYPGDFGLLPYGKPTLEDAKKFYDCANDIFEKVCNTLKIDKNEFNIREI